MGDGFYFIDILIFAVIAAFLVYRLSGVLGRRHGEERQRANPYVGPRQGEPRGHDAGDNVVPLPERARAVEASAAGDEPIPLAQRLERIRAADPNFDEKHFLRGAQAAFEMIVDAFARGDTATLRPLLSDEVYDNFAAAIRAREAAKETHETRIEQIQDIDILDARLEGRTAYVTVKFVSEQMNVTRDADGQVVDGDPERAIEVIDIWTFARNTRSRDPNWLLIETRTPN